MAGTLEWAQVLHPVKCSCHSGPVFSSQLNDPAIVKLKFSNLGFTMVGSLSCEREYRVFIF